MKKNRTYRDFLSEITIKPSYREAIEWGNTWIDNANETNSNKSKRYLIIGDSTARMVRSTLAKLLNAPVDLIGSSSALDDELFVNQIDGFFNNISYKYDVIFVQMGHHSRTGKNGEVYSEKDYEKFKKDLISLLTYLRQHCDKIVLETVFSSVLPAKINKIEKRIFGHRLHRYLFKLGIRKEIRDNDINSVTDKKNGIIREVAKSSEFKLFFLDIDELISKQHFLHTDHIHYENAAKQFIAKKMCDALIQ